MERKHDHFAWIDGAAACTMNFDAQIREAAHEFRAIGNAACQSVDLAEHQNFESAALGSRQERREALAAVHALSGTMSVYEEEVPWVEGGTDSLAVGCGGIDLGTDARLLRIGDRASSIDGGASLTGLVWLGFEAVLFDPGFEKFSNGTLLRKAGIVAHDSELSWSRRPSGGSDCNSGLSGSR
jgi:hypothetical protein